jgi:N-acetylneuraminic acid mutarotase
MDTEKGAVMTATTARNKTQELASRESDGLNVVLLWHPRNDAVTVTVADSRTGDRFQPRSIASVPSTPSTTPSPTPRKEAEMKKLFALASLLVLGGSLGFMLAGCGSERTSGTGSSTATWRRLPAAPFAVPQSGASVWTGRQLILFGRRFVTALDARGNPYIVKSVDVAEAYDPAANAWSKLAPPPGPGYVPGYKAVWTGKQMLVFGAIHSVAFTPATNAWRELRKSIPGGIVVWTGREAIGWGGGCCGDAWSNGAAYNPATDTYRDLPRSPLAPSQGPMGAWTGHELILFVSGFDPDGKPYPARLARAAAYNPATNRWHRIAPLPAPRQGASAVWDGRELLVVGGSVVGSNRVLKGGFAYNPATNSWRRLAPMGSGRLGATAVWTGNRLLLWGGETGSPGSAAISRYGLAYDPKANRWSALPKAPLRARDGSTVVWTDHALIVWGGVIGTPVGAIHPEDYPKYLTDGAVYTPTRP